MHTSGSVQMPEQKRLLQVQLVELQVDAAPWRVSKILVPRSPQVARWWTDATEAHFAARVAPPLTGSPQIHVQISTPESFEVNNVTVHGIHANVGLPEHAVLESCRVGSLSVTADFKPLSAL